MLFASPKRVTRYSGACGNFFLMHSISQGLKCDISMAAVSANFPGGGPWLRRMVERRYKHVIIWRMFSKRLWGPLASVSSSEPVNGSTPRNFFNSGRLSERSPIISRPKRTTCEYFAYQCPTTYHFTSGGVPFSTSSCSSSTSSETWL